MGFASTSTTTTLVAKLTPYGRQQLLTNSSSAITHFALGDSDAYYGATLPLTTGQVPASSGNKGVSTNVSNSVAEGYAPKSLLFVNAQGIRKKLVNVGSDAVINTKSLIGKTTVTGATISHKITNLTDFETDSLVNLFYSFKLPITSTDKTLFTGTTNAQGGYSNTAFSGIAQDEILILGVPNEEYGELLDGKSVKVELETPVTGYTLYGTYQQTLTSNEILDASFKEKSFNSSIFGNNIVLLFSDSIQKPNNNAAKSWATGYGNNKPFALGNKAKFNFASNTQTSTVADKAVGVAYLDKGIIVITDSTIMSELSGSTTGMTGTSISFNSVATQITQEITCVADRGQFATSSNKTFTDGDTARISEVLLLDVNDNILAVAKPDRHISKTAQQFIALGLKITV